MVHNNQHYKTEKKNLTSWNFAGKKENPWVKKHNHSDNKQSHSLAKLTCKRKVLATSNSVYRPTSGFKFDVLYCIELLYLTVWCTHFHCAVRCFRGSLSDLPSKWSDFQHVWSTEVRRQDLFNEITWWKETVVETLTSTDEERWGKGRNRKKTIWW